MRAPRLRLAAILVATLVPGGCRTYVRSADPVAPSAEIVRIPFARPQDVVLARGEQAAGDAWR